MTETRVELKGKKSPIHPPHPDTRILVEKLRAIEPGATVTYSEIAEWVGRDPQKQRGPLVSAMRRLLQEGIRYVSVKNVGVQRYTSSQIVNQDLLKATVKIGRAARRAVAVAANCVDVTKLSPDERRDLEARNSVLYFAAKGTSQSFVKRLREHVPESLEALPLSRTLEVFRETQS